MPAERFSIRVSKDYFLFCCAHFITYEGDDCERLHGHNYRVAVELDGPLDGNHYVFDFIALIGRPINSSKTAPPEQWLSRLQFDVNYAF